MLKRTKDKDLDTSLKRGLKDTRKSRLTRVYDRESLKELLYEEEVIHSNGDFDEEC